MVTMSKAIAGACILFVAASGVSQAQSPKTGGNLKFAVVAEPPSMDCHAVNTFAFIHPVRAHYSTLLTFKGSYADLRIVGDLASSWEVAADGLSYTFKLRDNVKFHDGSSLTSEDVKASYERIINPPAGVGCGPGYGRCCGRPRCGAGGSIRAIRNRRTGTARTEFERLWTQVVPASRRRSATQPGQVAEFV